MTSKKKNNHTLIAAAKRLKSLLQTPQQETELSEALVALEKTSGFMSSAKALSLAAIAWLRLGNKDKAIARLQQANKIAPQDTVVKQYLKKLGVSNAK